LPKIRKTKEINGVMLYECSKCKRMLPKELYFKKSKVKTGLTSRCRECIGEYDKGRLGYRREYMRTYREENREAIRECQRKWSINNPETSNRYRKEHAQEIKDYYKKWFSVHYKGLDAREKYRRNVIRRRTLKRHAPATMTTAEWIECLEYFDRKDAYTGKEMNEISKDHIIPLKKGGGYVKNNIVPCEKSVNSSKNGKDMEEWFRSQPFFSEERLEKIYKWIDTP